MVEFGLNGKFFPSGNLGLHTVWEFFFPLRILISDAGGYRCK